MSNLRGRIFKQAFTSTAGNSFLYVPSGASTHWGTLREIEYQVLYMYILLTTDATVANRNIVMQMQDTAGGTNLFTYSSSNIPASDAKSVSIIPPGLVLSSGTTLSNLNQIAIDLRLAYPMVLKISATNGVAGDAITGMAILREIGA